MSRISKKSNNPMSDISEPSGVFFGGDWAMPPLANNFFHNKKIGKHGLAPFVWALVSSENLPPPPYEILNTPLSEPMQPYV